MSQREISADLCMWGMQDIRLKMYFGHGKTCNATS